MNILVTGAKGFIGKHLVKKLLRQGYNVFEFDKESSEKELGSYIENADFIVHLAGINRPLSVEEFYDGNSNFTKHLIDLIKEKNKKTPIIFSSSIQAELDNDYGKSKKMGEDFLFSSGLPVYVYRLANVFGKWCKPNYNSVAATFCYNISHNLPIQIRDPNYVVHFNYVDDICDDFIRTIQKGNGGSKEIMKIGIEHDCSLGKLAELLYFFKEKVESTDHLPRISNVFELKLFITFMDYLSEEYSFNFAEDERGSFEEIYKSKKFGQISINISKPNIVKGGHYHTYKKEKFMTVKGNCLIRTREINKGKIIEHFVCGDDSKIIDIPVGYTHDIKNIGDEDSVTIMWISEIYSDKTADTYKKGV